MARNTPLAIVRSYVKAESFQNLDASSTADDQRLNQLILNVQSQLSGSFDWSFLKKRWTFGISAGARFISFPSVDDSGVPGTPNFDRPETLQIKYASIWQPIVYGISEDPEFNYLDSDENQVLDPIQRWQFYDENQIEVWPLPASSQTLRYVGQRQLTSLVTSYNFVSNINVTNAGANYTLPPIVSFTGGGGSGAAAVATINAGLIISVTVTVPGVGYTSAPNVVFTRATGDTTGANGAATAYLSSQNVFNDQATLDLDDYLIAYFVAATWLGEDNARYKNVMAKAQMRLTSLRGTNLSRTKTLIIGRDLFPNRQLLRQVPIVLVGGK